MLWEITVMARLANKYPHEILELLTDDPFAYGFDLETYSWLLKKAGDKSAKGQYAELERKIFGRMYG